MSSQITVGLSGGVDSAVAAYLLKARGLPVTGVFMKNWDDADPLCSAESDYADVAAVSALLGIPYYSVNFEREYQERVFASFLRDYRAGRTPNPDVLCNSEIKFAAFLDFALDSGSDQIATGHYARTASDGSTTLLLKGKDQSKDQSYFLCLLNQQQLSRALFPLGGLLKSEVRAIARELALPVAAKKDSTGICFIGERNFKAFLMQYFPQRPGPIRTLEEGTQIGQHDGLLYYTLGQRRGLGIGGQTGAGDGRWFVVGKETDTNTLLVSQSEEALYAPALYLDGLHFIAGDPQESFDCHAKIRYRQPDQRAQVTKETAGWRVSFAEPQRAVCPGQYCVLYDGEVCLGGGTIREAA
ncbi:MAG: tRNA 2-thiouridine(34) synthase MnmA [Clostridia bacterium]|nr:tRNA 2-thiouridine(34) synthase MnmA [Clostridia bacterium]